MATKVVDAAAAKQRQQKIILIVGAVLLVGLIAIQGPKLLKHGSSSSTAAPAATANVDRRCGDTDHRHRNAGHCEPDDGHSRSRQGQSVRPGSRCGPQNGRDRRPPARASSGRCHASR